MAEAGTKNAPGGHGQKILLLDDEPALTAVMQSLLERLNYLGDILPGGSHHGLDDVMIAGAAADIALELLPDRLLVEVAARS